MKKIVALGAIAALAGGMIFAEPVFEPSVTLSGEAKVQWGMDLDAGKTGFKNTTGGDFKVKLWGDGSRELEKGDGIWAELKSTGKAATIDKGTLKDGGFELNEAKLHINDFYIGIKSGDCVLGSYKFAGAIRGDDGDGSKWVTDQGPAKYTQGIVAGYGNDNFGIDVDFRSLEGNTQYTNSYAVAAEAQLKDSNEWVGGLAVKAGAAYQLSNEWYDYKTNDTDADGNAVYTADKNTGAESPIGKVTAVERHQYGNITGTTNGHVLGYGVSASYKLPVGDYYLKPAVAFAGNIKTGDTEYMDGTDKKVGNVTVNHNELAFGVMFGFGGDKGDNPGVPFLNGDESKKSEPGVSVVVGIPLADTSTTVEKETTKGTAYGKALAYIVPSFYTNGNFVENLKIGAYSEIVPLRFEEPDMKDSCFDGQADNPTDPTKWNFGKTVYSKDKESKSWENALNKDQTLAMAFALGLSYKVEIDAGAITPNFGIRYANAAYVDNNIAGISPLSSNPVFTKMGEQKLKSDEAKDADKKTGYYRKNYSEADYFNLKAGVDVNVIDNTTFSVEYASANLLNKVDRTSEKVDDKANANYNDGWKWYNYKLGTLNIGCKIAF